jgi:tetratricopeptide (TPR) repeat protein
MFREGLPMFEEQFQALFQTVQTICTRIDSTDTTERVLLRQKLSEIQELGVAWLDQWMALEEMLTDAFDKLGETVQKEQKNHSRTGLEQTVKIRYAPEPANVKLESIVFDMTNEVEVALRRGMAYFDLLMFEEATTSLEQAVPSTDEPAARLFLAASYTALGRLSDGRSQLDSIRGYLKTPILACASSEIEAVICLREGDTEGAIRSYLNALSTMPAYTDVWFNLGACYLAGNEPVAAERMLAHVLNQDKYDKEAWLLYIYALVQQRAYKEADKECVAAIEAFPDDFELMNVYSHVCKLTNQLHQGGIISHVMMKEHPLRPEGYLHASWYAFWLGDIGVVQAILKKMLTLFPNHPAGLLQFSVSEMLSPNGTQKQKLLKVPVQEPYREVLFIISGMVHSDELQILQAIQSKNLSVRKLAFYTCGTLLMKKHQYRDAMQFLLSANAMGESNYAVLAALHETALALGRKDEAQIFLDQACMAEKQDLLKCH